MRRCILQCSTLIFVLAINSIQGFANESSADQTAEFIQMAAESFKGGDWIVAPIPYSNPTVGVGLGVVGAYFVQLEPDSEPSIFGVGGFYGEQGSFGLGGLIRTNHFSDKFRTDLAFGLTEINYNFYGVGEEAGKLGISAPINQEISLIRPKLSYRLFKNIYIGAQYRYLNSTTSVSLFQREMILKGGADSNVK